MELNLIHDPLERSAQISGLLDRAGIELVPEVQSAIRGSGNNRPDAVETALLLRYWARHEPREASQWALRQRDAAFRDQMVRDAFSIWARHKPLDAAADGWSGGTTAASVAALEGLITGWFASGQDGLDDFVRELGISDNRQRAISIVARERMLRDGAEATTDWARTLSGDSVFKTSIVRRVGTVLAAESPAHAVAWCDEHCEGRYGSLLRQFISTEWAKKDGRATMEWLLTAPDNRDTDVAVRAAFRRWALEDPESAYPWMAKIPQELRSDARLQGAVGMYISRIAWRDHERAIDWTKYLSDPEERELARVTAVRRWLFKDPASAEAWIGSSDLLSAEAIERARIFPKSWTSGGVGSRIKILQGET